MAGILIAGRAVGPNQPPFIVAEMSGNHNQSLETALKIVEAAAKAGAHALKLQTYTADTITLDMHEGDFFINDPKSLWNGASLYSLYQKAYTPWEWHEPIFKRARELGMIALSTPFDETAVDFLETLNVPCYKIASFEMVHLPLIRKVAKTGKPVIISTGLASPSDIQDAVNAARGAGCKELILLKGTSTYPASPADCNLLTIPHMRQTFGCQVGLSDHTQGIGAAVASVALGATVIEKHVKLSDDEGGVDAEFSLNPATLKLLVGETARAWQALGKVHYELSEQEQKSLQFRRSVYIAKDVQAGQILTQEHVRIVRPGFGLAPKELDNVLGKPMKTDAKKGSRLRLDMVS